MKRKISSCCLVLAVLVLTLLTGISASAASNRYVAKIGNKKYTSLSAAVKNVKSGQTIKVTSGIATSGSLVIHRPNVKFTIDFGKQNYISTGKDHAIRVEAGSVTIKNARLTAKQGEGELLHVNKGAKAVIDGGTFKSKMFIGKENLNNATYAIYNKGTLTIKKGSFIADFDSDMRYAGLFLIGNTGTMKISGGTFKGDRYGMLENWGNLTISGGSLISTAPEDNFMSWGPYNFNDGIVTITGGKLISACSMFNSGKLAMKGGTLKCAELWGRDGSSATFSGKCKVEMTRRIGTQAQITITGGTFKSSSKEDAMLYAASSKGRITVEGGRFIGKKTYLYEESDSGKVNFIGKNYIADIFSACVSSVTDVK